LFGVGWPDSPHRALRTPFVERWRHDEAHGQTAHPEDAVLGRTTVAGRDFEVREFVCFPPNREATGEIESMGMLAGQCVGAIHELRPAAEIVRELVDGMARIGAALGRG